MGVTRVGPRRRARRILSLVLVGLLAVGGGGALALSGGDAAYALNPLFNTIPENTPITHSPFLFQGTADPGDPVTVDSGGHGPDCNTVTDGLGNWSCNLILTSSTDVTVITATRPDDGTPAQDSEGWEYPIALPVSIDETQPGQVLSNNLATVVTGSGAWPTASMIVTIGGLPCAGGPADGSGNWSCTPPGGLAPGSHALVAQQDVGAAVSDATNSTYVYDTSTFMPTIDSPYDSTLAPVNIATSDTTPTMTGNAGSAEPFATVHILADDRGPAPIAHPDTEAFTPWCDAVADGAGAWSCTGPPMTVGNFWMVSVFAEDLAGNTGPSPDGEFGIEILQPPDAPTVINPAPGFGEISPFVVNGTVDAVTTEVRVTEGATDLCGPVLPAALAFNCAPVLAPGPHTLDFTAFDVYGTGSTTSVSVDSWADPTISLPTPAYQTSESTLFVWGDAPIGSDLEVRLDGFPVCNLVPAGTTEFVCPAGFVAVGPHTIDVDYTDPWGTPSGPASRNITIVPTLPAPVFVEPLIGYASKNKVVHVEMTNAAEGTVYVREGAFDLCPPTPTAVATFSCDTVPLSVGVHTIRISQTDQYGVMSAPALRQVTILPTPFLPLTMKTFGFTFRVLGPDGSVVGPEGLDTGETFTVEATGVPPGTLIQTEIHSTPVVLGSETIGQNGQMALTTVVPPVEPGAHEIVVSASAPGYAPAAFSTPVVVRGLKHIPGSEDTTPIKELGEPDDVKELGEITDGSGSGPGGQGGPGGYGFDDPTEFGSSVESPFDAQAQAFQLTVAGIALTGSLGLAFLLMVGLPAELLESTIRSNYDRAFGWLARIRRRVAKIVAPIARVLGNPWIGSGVTILAASILLGFADPGYGFNGASVRLTIAMLLAVVAINVGLTAIVMRVANRAFDARAMLQPMPAALALVGLSVLVSRLAGISPGFLFGIVLGVTYLRELRLRDEGRLGALGVGLTLAAGLLAWLGYGIASTASGPGFWNNLAIETFAAITLEALGTLVIALLPIEFLDGRTIFRWSKPAWIGLYLTTALVFLFVVVPMSGNWGTMSAPIFGWGTLFAVFAVVAIATWLLFRRKAPATPSSRQGAGAPPRERR